ncbi:MAG TPA: VOC family protein [Burkholderiaceae bacterium]|nr:VOC family protein [Burkholderiaceae bacterium]
MRNWRGLWFVCALGASGAALGQSPVWPPVGEPTTAPRVTGRWLWADLVTADAARSRDFYAALFGWQIRDAEGAGQPSYLTITANGRMIGGIVQAANATSGARWIELVDGDPKALAERAVQHGGKVVVAPRTLPGRGDFMVLADPAGAHFAVVLPERGDPADHVGGRNEWIWSELWTPDPAQAAAFYRDVFGYTIAAAPRSAGSPTDAYVLSAGGRARAGVMKTPDSALPAVWIPYVRVDDVAAMVARARTLGARVLVPPQPHHRSQVAVLVDPMGAPFALADWKPQP